MLDKTFDPKTIESRQYTRSESAGAFRAGAGKVVDGQPYTIMMPPPNVTGSLHIGHALTFTLQDILIRWRRMRGDDVLWQPGTDHAGIATQMVVERELAKEGLTRQAMGREAFLERVWDWKATSGGTIISQLKRLGASADWSRERFTMDEGLSAAVRKVFVQLYRDGLIYKDKRLVNWDVQLQTAISDLEVVQKEVKGAYYHIRYPLVDGSGHITVATTRPETMLGDVAVAVHPDNEKYRDLIGKQLHLPLTNRTIPVIADDYADPEKGTGAVKITPAHDFNDFEVGRRHNLPMLSILDASGRLHELAPEGLRGLDRFAARKQVVALLEEQGLLEKIEDTTHTVPHGDRSGTVIEPFLTEQWYVRADVLARPALQAVADDVTRFVPEQWKNTYYSWLREIQPWCISRQLWWGHRIPAWYAADGSVYVAETEAEAQAQAGPGVALTQDPDVLDTWFSSALWPFSTLGWPENTPELERYYPGSVLVTGFDIIFFWVARMMMMGMYFRAGEYGFADKIRSKKRLSQEEMAKIIPFRDVYIHALVRDKHGQKMSKSKGNVIDPLELIDQYGTDALRFTLAIMAAQGRDVKLDPARIEGYRNFATKLWNAARFGEMNGCFSKETDNLDISDPEKINHPINKWILFDFYNNLFANGLSIASALERYEFDKSAQLIYNFVWNTFCDWYVEFAKVLFNDPAYQQETRAVFKHVFKNILLILHPFMPFITDELAENLDLFQKPLTLCTWPEKPKSNFWGNTGLWDARREIETWIRKTGIPIAIESINAIRSARVELNVPAAAKLTAYITGEHPDEVEALKNNLALLKRLARLENVLFDNTPLTQKGLQVLCKSMTLFIPLDGIIDFDAEAARLTKEREKLDKELSSLEDRLSNPAFLAKAPEAVVAEGRARIIELSQKKENLERSLRRLQAV
jgi:valyl-tRNA synthetase